MKIGIYAGSFDPVHNGHIDFARQSIEIAQLDKVILVAEKEPKTKKSHASWDHRQAMIERATEEVNQVEHDYHFASQLAHQHTAPNILEVASTHFGADNKFYLLLGSDAFEHTNKLLKVAHLPYFGGFIIYLRPDHTEEWVHEKLQALKISNIENKVSVITTDSILSMALRSSDIRSSLYEDKPTSGLSPKVEAYIKEHQLYTL